MRLLETLTLTPSVPGNEGMIRAVIKQAVAAYVDELYEDALGSLIAVRKSTSKKKRPKKLLLMAHMDQIGFVVRYIDDKGRVRIQSVGGFDMRNLFARRVQIYPRKGSPITGILNPAGKPIHIASTEERKKIPEIQDFYVDLHMGVKKVKSLIKVGDMIVLEGRFEKLGSSIISQCLDNRVGCWALIKTLKAIKHSVFDLYCVWSVQEEVGCRGAGPATFGINPDLAINCDTTLCCEVPGVSPEDQVSIFGGGVCLHMLDPGFIADYALVETLDRIAKKKKIKTQRTTLLGGSQDGAVIHKSRSGVRTACLAAPIKNIHTVTETAHEKDLQNYYKLLVAYIQES